MSVPRVVPPHGTLPLAEIHGVPISLFLQLAELPLKGRPTQVHQLQLHHLLPVLSHLQPC